MGEKKYIAFFDSGQGGLTVWDEVTRAFQVNTLYLGDTARYPYGNRSFDTIQAYVWEAVKFLQRYPLSHLVIACGTASSVSLTELKSKLNIPVIGIVDDFCDYIDTNFCNLKQKTVAVLATRMTVQKGKFDDILKKKGFLSVWQKACPLFVPLVEEGVVFGEIAERVCDLYLEDLPSSTSVIMLACTHFPRIVPSLSRVLFSKFNRPIIQRTAHGDFMLDGATSDKEPIYIVDSSAAIVSALRGVLKEEKKVEHKIFCTDSPENFQRVAFLFKNK